MGGLKINVIASAITISADRQIDAVVKGFSIFDFINFMLKSPTILCYAIELELVGIITVLVAYLFIDSS